MLSSSPLLSLSSFRSSYLDVEDGDDDDNGWLADLFLSTVKTVMTTIIMVESTFFVFDSCDGATDGRTDGRTNERTYERADGQREGWTDGWRSVGSTDGYSQTRL